MGRRATALMGESTGLREPLNPERPDLFYFHNYFLPAPVHLGLTRRYTPSLKLGTTMLCCSKKNNF